MAKQWCKNYRGMFQKETCEVGVKFNSLPLYGQKGFYDACPCFGPNTGCEKAVYPTPEEMATEEAELKMRFANMAIARSAIVEHLGGPWKKGYKTYFGSIKCPVCSGELMFSRAGCNGHIHAACKTENCVSWME